MKLGTFAPLATPPGLVNFGYLQRGAQFGYAFTRHFGDQDTRGPALQLGVHILEIPSHRQTVVDLTVTLSCPLCDMAEVDWTTGLWHMHSQINELSNHMSNIELKDFLGHFWAWPSF